MQFDENSVIEHAESQARYARMLGDEWIKVAEAFERVAQAKRVCLLSLGAPSRENIQ